MFKKSLKTLALVATTYTVAEFLTMWRMQTTKSSFKQFSKIYFRAQPAAFRDAYKFGYNQAAGNPSESFADLMTKKYPN